MSLRDLIHSSQDVSFSTFNVENPTTDLIQQKLLGLVSYFDNVDYSKTDMINDLFYWALQGNELYKINWSGFEYFGNRVNGNEFVICIREPYKRIVNIKATSYQLVFNPFLGAKPERFGAMYGMASNGIGRRLDSSAQIKIYWKTKVASGLEKVWENIRTRLTQQQKLAREFNGVSVIGENDDIKQIQPDYSGSLMNDGGFAIDVALSEYSMPRDLLTGSGNEVSIISFTVQKVMPLLKQLDPRITFNQQNFVAYISTASKDNQGFTENKTEVKKIESESN